MALSFSIYEGANFNRTGTYANTDATCIGRQPSVARALKHGYNCPAMISGTGIIIR